MMSVYSLMTQFSVELLLTFKSEAISIKPGFGCILVNFSYDQCLQTLRLGVC